MTVDENAQRFTVLAVDDTPENLDIIKGVLVPEYRLKSAISGQMALKIAQSKPPDLILLDIMMPNMDGYEVCRKLKESAVTRDIPVIFVTAMGEEMDELKGFELGAVDYVRKPLSPPILKARVEAHTALKKAREELHAKNVLLKHERDVVEQIVVKMRSDRHFEPQRLRYCMEALERTNGDVLFSGVRPDGGQHILLGDFTGHGLTAAIGGPLVAAFFYSRTQDGLSVEEVMTEINEVLQNQLPVSMFMAAGLVEISPDGKRFRLWNAGLPDILYIRDDDTRELIRFASTMPPLGITRGLSLGDGEWCDWHSDARLFLYSDGLVEPMNEEGEMFGEDRLAELLVQPGLRENGLGAVIERIKSFSVSGGKMDDMTLVEIHGKREA